MATMISAELRKTMNTISDNKCVSPSERDKVNQMLWDELVPIHGNCDTVAGEIIRAVNRVIYRFYNDGDIAGHGYGRETVNPAIRFLAFILKDDTCDIIFGRFASLLNGSYISDSEYEHLLNELTDAAILYIAHNESWEIENTRDFWDFRDALEDVDNDPYEEEE